MESDHIIVVVTVPTIAVGRKIARLLIEKKLAAAVNISPGITSIYNWKTEIFEKSEVLMFVKTRAELFNRLSIEVKAEHPYQVPQIIAMPIIAGFDSYLRTESIVTAETAEVAE